MEGKNPQIFGIGISGLVGTRIVELLADTYDFENLSIDTGVDITRPETLQRLEDDTDHNVVILMAAKTDVDGCERDRDLGENGAAWKINVDGAKNVIAACRKNKKKLLYVSTDFVFGGEKPGGEFYQEDDEPRPVNWYGETKLQAEELVRSSGLEYAILRLAYPYRTPFPEKKDLVQAIQSRLHADTPVSAVTDHFMSPTFVDDFAEAIRGVLRTGSTGTYHAVGSEVITPYALARKIAEVFELDASLIQETTREAFFKDRAPRPFNLALNNDRIKKLGVEMKTIEEGLLALKMQMSRTTN